MLAQLMHTKTYAHTLAGGEKAVRLKITLPLRLRALLFVRLFSGMHRHTYAQSVTASPLSDKNHSGGGGVKQIPPTPRHYMYHFLTVTVTQVGRLMVVDINGSTCVMQRDFVTLLLTRAGCRLDIAQLRSTGF